MAVILKKKKVQEESASSSALSFNALLTGMRRLPAVTAVSVLGGVFLVSGLIAGANSEDVPSRAAPASSAVVAATASQAQALAKPVDAQKEVSELNNQASKIVAALLAYKQERGSVAGKVTELIPRYLSPAEGAERWASKWAVEGYSLRIPGLSEEACRLLSGGKLTPIDHGRTGLQCVSEKGAHQGIYRIDEGEPPLKGFWKFDIEGKLTGKLSIWKVQGSETFVQRCHGDNVNAGKAATEWTQEVELDAKNATVKRVLCLPAYEQEVTPLEQGMSLLEGHDHVALSGMANEAPWSLNVSAQACDFGARVSATIFLKATPSQALPPNVSCDLRSR